MKAYNLRTQEAWYAYILVGRESIRRFLIKQQVGTSSILNLNAGYTNAKERLSDKQTF